MVPSGPGTAPPGCTKPKRPHAGSAVDASLVFLRNPRAVSASRKSRAVRGCRPKASAKPIEALRAMCELGEDAHLHGGEEGLGRPEGQSGLQNLLGGDVRHGSLRLGWAELPCGRVLST
jgi:hypothetical protein